MSLSPLLTIDMVLSQFYVPSMEEKIKTIGMNHPKEESIPMKQPPMLLHEAQDMLERHRTSFLNQQGVQIRNRLESYLKLDTDVDNQNTWQFDVSEYGSTLYVGMITKQNGSLID